MAIEFLVKRLIKQAGVSVLSGLLLSSAALAEDNSGAAVTGDEGWALIAIGEDNPVGGPDAVDPVENPEFGEDDPIGGPDAVDPVENPECSDCGGIPDISIDPVEMFGSPEEDFGTTAQVGAVRGDASNQRGGHMIGERTDRGASQSIGRDAPILLIPFEGKH